MTIKSFFVDLWESMLEGSPERVTGPNMTMYERNLWRATYDAALKRELEINNPTDVAVLRAADSAFVAVIIYRSGRN